MTTVPWIGNHPDGAPTLSIGTTDDIGCGGAPDILILLSHLFGALPRSGALFIGRLVGLVWFYVIPIRRAVALKNVARVYGDQLSPREQRRLVRANFMHLGMYVAELLRIPSLTPERAEQLSIIEGREHLDAALARGKGVLLIASHVGNVDLAGTSMAIRGYPITVVAKDMGKMTRAFVTRIRERTGVTIIPPRRSKERITELLEQNAVVVLIMDQHVAAHRALVCRFFDQLAATAHGPARFGLDTEATVLLGVCYRRPDGTHVSRIEPGFEMETPSGDRQIDLRHNTERLNRAIERWVREFPEQWLWVHKRWKVQDNPADWDVPEDLTHLLADVDADGDSPETAHAT